MNRISKRWVSAEGWEVKQESSEHFNLMLQIKTLLKEEWPIVLLKKERVGERNEDRKDYIEHCEMFTM